MPTVLTLSDMCLHRGNNRLIAGLSCTFHAGEVVVVLGPNGVGKSSLLLALAGLIPCQGEVMLQGFPLNAYSLQQRTQQIAWQGTLPPTEFGLTVEQRLMLVTEKRDMEIQLVATKMDISPLLSRPLGLLSSGERQRVELAALMLRDAVLWLLDEPTAHLDLKHQIRCIQMLREQRKRGRAIITVLHDLQQARAIADHLLLLDGNGRTELGRAEALCSASRMGMLFDVPVLSKDGVPIPDYSFSTLE